MATVTVNNNDASLSSKTLAVLETAQTWTALQTFHSLRVGSGSTPDVTLGADDVFIEGTLEVDGAARFDGGGDIASGNLTFTGGGNLAASGSPIGTGYIDQVILSGVGSSGVATLGFGSNAIGFRASNSAALIRFVSGSTDRWLAGDSALYPATDNVYALGVAGSNRFSTGYFGTALAIGTNPATVGEIRTAYGSAWYARNNANNADVGMVALTTGDVVTLGFTNSGGLTLAGGLKADTGDPGSPAEGQITINTFDNAIKIYADGAWRTLATW